MAAEGSSRNPWNRSSAAAASLAKEEQDGLIDAFLMFGHDWKEVEDLSDTRTRTKSRNHSQKYLSKVQRNGQIMYVPAPRAERKSANAYSQKASKNGMASNYNQNASWNGSSSRSHPVSEVTKHEIHSYPDLAEAYNFLGQLFDPDIKCASEVHLQRLKEMDPVTAKAVLLMMQNLTVNLSSPDFELLRKCLSTYDEKTQTLNHNGCCSYEDDM